MNTSQNQVEIQTHIPRVLFIGDSFVGKTSIVNRIKKVDPCLFPFSTLGADLHPHSACVNRKDFNYLLVDTSGQEAFRCVLHLYFKSATIVILVFSLCDEKSLNNAPCWIRLLSQHCSLSTKVILVGNKCDTKPSKDIIQKSKSYASENNFEFIITSALNGKGINELTTKIENICYESLYEDDIQNPFEKLKIRREKKNCNCKS
jgi:small GTP-binding protein